jgi:hypothetical protein
VSFTFHLDDTTKKVIEIISVGHYMLVFFCIIPVKETSYSRRDKYILNSTHISYNIDKSHIDFSKFEWHRLNHTLTYFYFSLCWEIVINILCFSTLRRASARFKLYWNIRSNGSRNFTDGISTVGIRVLRCSSERQEHWECTVKHVITIPSAWLCGKPYECTQGNINLWPGIIIICPLHIRVYLCCLW